MSQRRNSERYRKTEQLQHYCVFRSMRSGESGTCKRKNTDGK